MAKDEGTPISLEGQRAQRFFRLLADEPFVALVVTDDEVRIFSKGIEADHLDHIRTVLGELGEDS